MREIRKVVADAWLAVVLVILVPLIITGLAIREIVVAPIGRWIVLAIMAFAIYKIVKRNRH